MAGYAVTYYFFMGVMFYHWREKIPVSWPLFLVSGAIGYAMLSGHHFVFLAAPFVTYCTLFFGMLPIPKIKLISSGDYSYGLYLYGFPITQAVLAAIPALRGHGWATMLISLSLAILFAAASWHLIEKRALKLKNRLPARLFPATRPAPVSAARWSRPSRSSRPAWIASIFRRFFKSGGAMAKPVPASNLWFSEHAKPIAVRLAFHARALLTKTR
jgi:peptidoglycan/LPS O-acetylase OafA/YrhL